MRLSRLPLTTLKEVPADAEIVSHRLMLRAGLIRKLAAGTYTWMPLGLRVVRKIERIVREEMDRSGALELLMPMVQPAELWEESSRWSQFGPELLRFTDRHDRAFCLGPTHEEVITDIARRELKSYRQLPVNYYQIQTKFRDEVRPRFGVIRAREFIMKDAYSFHIDEASLADTYRAMHDAYTRMFTRMGLEFRAVRAHSGSIGGSVSEEFHVLASSGEDAIVFSDADDYAANIELAEAAAPAEPRAPARAECEEVATPDVRSIEALTAFLDVEPRQCIKTLLVEAEEGGLVAVALRGDHELNPLKAQRLPGVASPLTLADPQTIVAAVGCEPGFIGPVGLDCPLYADHAAARLADFVCGANRNDYHRRGANWGRDAPEPVPVDLRNVVEGDPSPTGKGRLHIARGIEVGHIFQLGTKYSEAMNATVLDEQGESRRLVMGCYGIGITRIAAAAIEQNNDERGMIWPEPIAPFQVIIVGLNLQRAARVAEAAESLYQALSDAGVEVLYDDREARPGVKFAEADLLGIPHRLVVAERGLAEDEIEYRHRRDSESTLVSRDRVLQFVRERLGGI